MTSSPVPCKLRAGDVIKCRAFADRMSDEAGGYDLVCRDDREHGKLMTSDKNELLRISDYDAPYNKVERMAELAKLRKVPLTIMNESFWGIL